MFDGQPKTIEFFDSAAFNQWRQGLPPTARHKLDTRLDRIQRYGNPGKPQLDWKVIGEGVCELKIHEGVGYRVYFAFRGGHAILLLCGGAKPAQAADIKKAKKRWADWQRRTP